MPYKTTLLVGVERNAEAVGRVQSFPPIVSERSKLFILGSMPGEVSLKAGQYYAHPRHAFWPIMGELFGTFSQSASLSGIRCKRV